MLLKGSDQFRTSFSGAERYLAASSGRLIENGKPLKIRLSGLKASLVRVLRNGAKRIRTADPFNAIEVRYQLRYSPSCAL